MTTTSVNDTVRGIYSLPNELLYSILEPLPTTTILQISPSSRRLHSLCVRLLHNRLTLAAGLANHVLYLEAYHPSAKLTANGLYCESLGTPDMQEILDSPDEAAKIGRLGNLYSVFRPQRREPKKKRTQRHPAGDIPGSRTFTPPADDEPESSRRQDGEPETEVIGETVSLDAHELFTQLCAVVHMVKVGRQGLFAQLVDVCDGMIRVWRDWLKSQAELGPRRSRDGVCRPTEDARVLWVNKGDKVVGIRCTVRERKWRRDTPILVASEDEVAVSYHVEFEQLYIRTSHLLFKLENLLRQKENAPSNAVIFI